MPMQTLMHGHMRTRVDTRPHVVRSIHRTFLLRPFLLSLPGPQAAASCGSSVSPLGENPPGNPLCPPGCPPGQCQRCPVLQSVLCGCCRGQPPVHGQGCRSRFPALGSRRCPACPSPSPTLHGENPVRAGPGASLTPRSGLCPLWSHLPHHIPEPAWGLPAVPAPRDPCPLLSSPNWPLSGAHLCPGGAGESRCLRPFPSGPAGWARLDQLSPDSHIPRTVPGVEFMLSTHY